MLVRKPSFTRNSHSRSFILQSVTGQVVAYHHIILLALSPKFQKK